MFRTTIICVAACLASGCVSTGIYHDDWAGKAKLESDGCAGIDGEYRNEGETFQKVDGRIEAQPVGLLKLLAQGYVAGDVPGDGTERIALRLADKTLQVTTTSADGSTSVFERPVASCGDSMIVLDTEWTHSLEEEGGAEMLGMTMGMVHYFDRQSWKLGRAEDGSLLVRSNDSGSLMFYWWPVLPFSETDWFRFPAVEPSQAVVVAAASRE